MIGGLRRQVRHRHVDRDDAAAGAGAGARRGGPIGGGQPILKVIGCSRALRVDRAVERRGIGRHGRGRFSGDGRQADSAVIHVQRGHAVHGNVAVGPDYLAVIVHIHFPAHESVGPAAAGGAPTVQQQPVWVGRIGVVKPHQQHRVPAALLFHPGMPASGGGVKDRAFVRIVPEVVKTIPVGVVAERKAEVGSLVLQEDVLHVGDRLGLADTVGADADGLDRVDRVVRRGRDAAASAVAVAVAVGERAAGVGPGDAKAFTGIEGYRIVDTAALAAALWLGAAEREILDREAVENAAFDVQLIFHHAGAGPHPTVAAA